MIKTKIMPDGRIRTWSDAGLRVRQLETGIIYDDAVDSVAHSYEETDEPIPDYGVEPTSEDYEKALARLGVETRAAEGVGPYEEEPT